MGTVYMNARCKRILYLLLVGGEYIKMQQIAEEMGVSRRSVYYDLCRINEWLGCYDITEIVVERGKGIRISEEDRRRTEQVIERENGEESYIFSPSERVKIIICYIIHIGEPVYIEQLSEYCQVSRNTIFNDLRVVVNQLQEYNLNLDYESKKGYRVTGDVITVRALFFLYFNTLLPLFDSGVLTFLNREEIQKYLNKLKTVEGELGVEYVEGILLSLAALLPIMFQEGEKPYFPSLRPGVIEQTQEYALVRKQFPGLHEKEQIYLCLHLLGSRIQASTGDMFDHSADQSVYEITKALVAEFEKKACVTFEDREELERSLFVHIKTSLYRYQYGIQIGNPMGEDVMREYPDLFDITRMVTEYLEQMIGLPVPDSEVAYLALHFGAFLKISKNVRDQLRILIVCGNGVSTGNMLKREVQKLLPYARIVDVVAAGNVHNIQEICDLVISTLKVKSVVPSLVVHPILTDYDRKAILNHRLVVKGRKVSESGALFHIVKKYVAEEHHEELKRELKEYFRRGQEEIEIPFAKEPPGLAESLREQRIRITEEELSWQAAIRYGGQPLLEGGSIEKRYLDNIISQIRYYGPYMFVTQGVVLAHSKPEEGSKKLDVSLAVFRKPVKFSEFHRAKVIITLATEDQEKHLKILKDIMTVFSEDTGVERIWSADTEKEVLARLEEYTKTPC